MTAVQEIEALDVAARRRRRAWSRCATARGSSTCCPATGGSLAGGPHPHVRRGLARPAAPDPADGDGRGGEVLELPDGAVVQPDPRRAAAVPAAAPGSCSATARTGPRSTAPHGTPPGRSRTQTAAARRARARHHRARRRELPLAVPRADHLRAQRRQAHASARRCATSTAEPFPAGLRAPPVPAAHRCRPSACPPRRPRASPCSRSPPRRATRWSTPSRRAPPAPSRRAPTSASRGRWASSFIDDVLTAWEPGAPAADQLRGPRRERRPARRPRVRPPRRCTRPARGPTSRSSR